MSAPREALVAASLDGHICTCGDCDLGAMLDRCKYEAALRVLDGILKPTALVGESFEQARAIISEVLR